MNEPRPPQATHHIPVAVCVALALERYLRDIDGAPVTDVYAMVLREVERPLLEVILRHARGSQARTAQILGISRNTLRAKLKRHGLASRRAGSETRIAPS